MASRSLPAQLLTALAGQDVVLVTSRSPSRSGSVRMGFAVGPPGVVYLLTQSFSVKALRWEADPWVRLTDPGTGISAEGVAERVGVRELGALAPVLADRFMASGAATPEALRTLLEGGTHVLLRVCADATP